MKPVCLKGDYTPRATSLLYAWLQRPNIPSADRFRENWSKDLGIEISDRQWQKACILVHKCSLSTRMQETSFKLLSQWYATPAKLNKLYPQTSDLCWRCQKEKGTLLHIWWQCPIIASFWSEVSRIICLITETTLSLDVACCLLHVTKFSFKKYKNSLSRHLLNAAKSLIPLHWKSTNIPSIRDWFHKIIDICDMEETVAQSNDLIECYHKTWSPWFAFRYSKDFEDLNLV